MDRRVGSRDGNRGGERTTGYTEDQGQNPASRGHSYARGRPE